MSREKIAIDLDDVLAGNAAAFTAFSNERWGTSLRPDDYDEDWTKMWGIGLDEAIRRGNEFFETNTLRNYLHDETAVPVLQRLSDRYDLVIATSRRLQTRQHTLEWVHERYPGIFSEDVINFAGIWDAVTPQSIHVTKADMVRQLNADYLIDDQLKHCKAVASLGKRALLFGVYSWNQTETLDQGVTRVEDWAAIERYFSEAGR